MTGFECVRDVAAEIGIGDHLLDGLNAGNRLLRKRKAESDGSQQLAVNVDRATAHTLQHAGLLQRTSAKLRQDDCLLWADVLNYTEDFNLEFFDAVSFEDCAANTVKSRANIFQWKKVLGSGQNAC